MGCCYCNDDAFPVGSPIQCTGEGCEFVDGPCSRARCAFTSLVANYLSDKYGHDDGIIFSLQGSFHNVYDLRDQVLQQSSLGRDLMDAYSRHAKRAAEIVQRDESLLDETVRLFLIAANFARNVTLVGVGRTEAEIADQRLRKRAVLEARVLLERFRELARDPEFDEPLDHAEKTLSLFEGLTAAQMWERLQRGLELREDA